MAKEMPMVTRFARVVDNKKFRLPFAIFLCILMFGDLVLAGMSFKYYPNVIYGALAWQIVLSVGMIGYTGFFVWRNLDGVEKKRAWIWIWINIGVICLWLTAFFSLAIMLGKSGNNNSNNNSNNSNNSGNNQGGSNRLAVRADPPPQPQNFFPAIGCVVLNLAFVFFFLVNVIYIYFRTTELFPKYAEISEDGQAFNAEMNDTHDPLKQDEESHETANGSAPGGYSSYGVYEGQNDYRPGGQYNPPARYNEEQYNPPARYDEELDAHNAGNTSNYSGRVSPIPYPIPAAGEAPYAHNGQIAYQGQTAYAGQTTYGGQLQPGRQVSPTPYPRNSVMGGNGYRDA